MKPAICIPIIDTTVEKMIESMQKIQNHVDFIELRVDYLTDGTQGTVEKLLRACKKPAIFTCRTKSEGGQFHGAEDFRRFIIQNALNVGFPYVDIELTTMKEHAFHKTTSKIILSHHDFKQTPDYWDLMEIIDEMSSYAPDGYKIATTVQAEKDTHTLFRLLANKQGKTMIVAGMGEHGKIVRIMAPFLGSLVTFAAGDSGTSAPGQLYYKDLQEIYKLLIK